MNRPKEVDAFEARVKEATPVFELAAKHAREIQEAGFALANVAIKLGVPYSGPSDIAEGHGRLAEVLEGLAANARKFLG